MPVVQTPSRNATSAGNVIWTVLKTAWSWDGLGRGVGPVERSPGAGKIIHTRARHVDRGRSGVRAWKIVLIMMAGLLLLAAGAQWIHWHRARTADQHATFLTPRLRIAGAQVHRIDRDGLDMDLTLLLDDPLPIGIKADSLRYRFFIGDVQVMKSTGPGAIAVPAWDSGSVVLPVRLDPERLVGVLDSLERRGIDSVDYAVDMELRPHVPVFRDPTLRFRTGRRLPVFHIPEVRLVHTRLEKLGLGESRVVLDLEVTNRNDIAFAFEKTEYAVRVEEDELLGALREDTIRIPPMDTVTIALPMELRPGRMAEALLELLLAPRRTSYAFRLNTTIVSDRAALDGSEFRVAADGTLGDLIHDRAD